MPPSGDLSEDAKCNAAHVARLAALPPGLTHAAFFASFAAELVSAAEDADVAAWHAPAAAPEPDRDALMALAILASRSRAPTMALDVVDKAVLAAVDRGVQASGGRVVAPGEAAMLDARLHGEKIALLICGGSGEALKHVLPFLAEDAVLVLLDAVGPPVVGTWTVWGMLSGRSWMGQRGIRSVSVASSAATEALAPEPPSELRRESGGEDAPLAIRLPHGWGGLADDATQSRSPLLLFEEGELLGPAHAPPVRIAKESKGAYGHWGERLWFSSRADANPLGGGRSFQILCAGESRRFRLRQANPHFDHERILWRDEYSGDYAPVPYEEQFDGQWKLFLEGKEGFVRHTGVDTSDEYIDDRIAELTGVQGFLTARSRGGPLGRLAARLGLALKPRPQENRDIGGRLFLEPKFDIGHFRGKRCLDIGCGAGRWTRTLLTLGASVKSVDMSEHGLRSTARFNKDVERLDLFDIIPRRPDLHGAFDFTLCWGVVMCTHDPLLAFKNVVCATKPGGEIYLMVYAPTYHVSDYVVNARKRFHRDVRTDHEKLDFVYEMAGSDRANAINYLDMLNTYYNWTIDEPTIETWCERFGLGRPHFLNAAEPHKGAHHVLIRKPV